MVVAFLLANLAWPERATAGAMRLMPGTSREIASASLMVRVSTLLVLIWPRRGGPGPDAKEVCSEARYGLHHLHLRALADGEHGYDGADAYYDAEHGERGPHLVGEYAPEGRSDYLEKEHGITYS